MLPFSFRSLCFSVSLLAWLHSGSLLESGTPPLHIASSVELLSTCSSSSLSAGNLDLFDGGNDLGCEEIEGFQVGHIGQTGNSLVKTHRRQFAEIGDCGCRGQALLPAILGEMNPPHDGFLDVRIRAAYGLAVLTQDGELALRF